MNLKQRNLLLVNFTTPIWCGFLFQIKDIIFVETNGFKLQFVL